MTHKVFRDAVHDMISLHREEEEPASDPTEWGDSMLLDLIDTPEMQRLRRIRQLGPAARIYPSAEHSRFSHSVGAMHLAKRIMIALSLPKGRLMERELMLAVKVAALFHDVGHGPYSHVFEHLMPGIEGHEIWGWRIISGAGPLRETIEKHCRRLGIDSAAFYEKLHIIWGHDAPSGEIHLAKQVIASQLDADRMDYLLRDAYFTGVSYGRYDLEWLLHSLRTEIVDGSPRLCVDLTKGPVALESYVTARDHMYRQVYDHKTVRAYEALLIHIFQLLVWIYHQEGGWPPGTPPPMARFLDAVRAGKTPDLQDYLALDDTVLDYCFGQWAESRPQTIGEAELRWKCRMFRDRRPVYRRIRWKSGADVIHDPEIAKLVDQFFRQRGDEGIAVLDIGGETHSVPLRLLVFVDRLHRAPYANMQYTAGRAEPVYVVAENGAVRPAEEVSDLIGFLGKSHRRQARVFVDPRAEAAVLDMVAKGLPGWM